MTEIELLEIKDRMIVGKSPNTFKLNETLLWVKEESFKDN